MIAPVAIHRSDEKLAHGMARSMHLAASDAVTPLRLTLIALSRTDAQFRAALGQLGGGSYHRLKAAMCVALPNSAGGFTWYAFKRGCREAISLGVAATPHCIARLLHRTTGVASLRKATALLWPAVQVLMLAEQPPGTAFVASGCGGEARGDFLLDGAMIRTWIDASTLSGDRRTAALAPTVTLTFSRENTQ